MYLCIMNQPSPTYRPTTAIAMPCDVEIFHTFTGKEKDAETGYGYFGARYMDHELTTMWLSVDPMSDKYPSISPYAYCAWNPVKLVDPDGMDWYRTTDADGKAHEQWLKRSTATYTDKDGHKWTNVGTDRVTLRNNTVIHQFQTIDKNGEYHLHTKTYTDNDLYSSMLAIAGLYSSAAEMMAEHNGTSFTFRYNPSAKGVRLTFYHNWGGGGRAHIKPIKLTPILRTAGKVFSFAGSIVATVQFANANSIEQKCEYAKDVMVGVSSIFYPPLGIYWALGGRKLEQINTEKMIERVKDGYNPGLMINQPSK